MKKINGMTVYEESDKCSLDDYSAALAQEVPSLIKEGEYDDKSIKKQLEELEQKEKDDISAIQEEQETQNTSITSNTTEIEKLKLENELLRSQIPTRKSNRSRGKSNR